MQTRVGMDRVEDLMRREFISIEPGASVLDAERTMRLARIRHLPVVEEGELVGVLSHRDVLEAGLPTYSRSEAGERADHLRQLPVARIMSAEAITTTPDTRLVSAAHQMLRHKVGCLPVVQVKGGRQMAIGLITESDLLRAAYSSDPSGTEG